MIDQEKQYDIPSGIRRVSFNELLAVQPEYPSFDLQPIESNRIKVRSRFEGVTGYERQIMIRDEVGKLIVASSVRKYPRSSELVQISGILPELHHIDVHDHPLYTPIFTDKQAVWYAQAAQTLITQTEIMR